MKPVGLLSLLGILGIVGEALRAEGILIGANSTRLSRKKRYLAFPTGSAFVMTLTLLKAIQLKVPSNWNLDLEMDVIWPIPDEAKLREVGGRVKGFRTRRHKRDLYRNLELALVSQGLPGRDCVLRAICEADGYLHLPGVSLVEDILRVILSHEDPGTKMDSYELAYRKNTPCHQEYPCPVSLLELLLNYDQ